MDDEMPFASHLVKRDGIYQYVRRVPKDIADASPLRRVQRSLRTKDRATAHAAGARMHAEIEERFAAARAQRSISFRPTTGRGPTGARLPSGSRRRSPTTIGAPESRTIPARRSTKASIASISGAMTPPCARISIFRSGSVP
jgi:hypothetical protein